MRACDEARISICSVGRESKDEEFIRRGRVEHGGKRRSGLEGATGLDLSEVADCLPICDESDREHSQCRCISTNVEDAHKPYEIPLSLVEYDET